jgi:hypothetical protein
MIYSFFHPFFLPPLYLVVFSFCCSYGGVGVYEVTR